MRKSMISSRSSALLLCIFALIGNMIIATADEKHYTFTIYVDDHSTTGHAFVGLSDGTDTQVNGFYPILEGYWDKLRALFGRNVSAAIDDDSGEVCKHDAAITWNITEEQYNALKQKIQEMMAATASKELNYNLYTTHGGLSCISFATTLAESVGLSVPEYIKGGRLPESFGVPDPKALYKSLKELWWAGGTWGDNATVDLHDPNGTIPGGSGGPSRIIDNGIGNPETLEDFYDITIDQQYLPPSMGETDTAFPYTHPISYIDPDESFVFWHFGDSYEGVIGSPLDSSNNYEVYHSFDEVGIHEGTLLIITNTTLYHFTFTTQVYKVSDIPHLEGGQSSLYCPLFVKD
jgi:hypothetical protein